MANLLRLPNNMLIDGIVKFSPANVLTKEGTLGTLGLNDSFIDSEF